MMNNIFSVYHSNHDSNAPWMGTLAVLRSLGLKRLVFYSHCSKKHFPVDLYRVVLTLPLRDVGYWSVARSFRCRSIVCGHAKK